MSTDTREVCVRQWSSGLSAEDVGPNSDFTVMTYNILSDVYIKPGSYEYCPEHVRFSESRTGHILAELEYYEPDFVCFQEVAKIHHMCTLLAEMDKIGYKRGFHVPYKYRPNDGLSIFYKPRLFCLLEWKKYQAVDLITEYAKNCDVPFSAIKAVHNLGKLSCGFLCGKFRQKSTNKMVTIGNIHTTWCDFMLPILQSLEIAVAKKALREMAGGGPIVFCGDFNSQPSYAPYCLLSRGHLRPNDPVWNAFPDNFRLFRIIKNDIEIENSRHETVEVFQGEQLVKNCALNGKRAAAIREEYANQAALKEFLCNINENMRMKSAYDAILGCEPEVTNCDTGTWAGHVSELCVDYLWHGEGLATTKVLETPPRESVRRHLALPSIHHPSDHLPLMAGFRFLELP